MSKPTLQEVLSALEKIAEEMEEGSEAMDGFDPYAGLEKTANEIGKVQSGSRKKDKKEWKVSVYYENGGKHNYPHAHITPAGQMPSHENSVVYRFEDEEFDEDALQPIDDEHAKNIIGFFKKPKNLFNAQELFYRGIYHDPRKEKNNRTR